MNSEDTLSREFEQAVLTMDRVGAIRIIEDVRERLTPLEAVERVVAPAMERIGAAWEAGEVALSQIYMSGRICEELVEHNFKGGGPLRVPQPRMAIGVLEDYHMLGKRIIHSVLRSAGYEVLDLGQGDVKQLAAAVAQEGVQLLFISTLMLRSALRVKDLRAEFERLGLNVRIVVGGAPFRFDQELWREVGADHTANGASELIPLIGGLIGEMLP